MLIKHLVVVLVSDPQLVLELFTSQICTTLSSLFIVDLLINTEARLADNVVFSRIVRHAVKENWEGACPLIQTKTSMVPMALRHVHDPLSVVSWKLGF